MITICLKYISQKARGEPSSPRAIKLLNFLLLLSLVFALMLAAFMVAAALVAFALVVALMLRCVLLVHHHHEALAVTELAAKDSLLLIECKCLECSPFGVAFLLAHLHAFAFVAFMVAALVLAFAFVAFMVAAFVLAFAFVAFMIAAFVLAFAFVAFMVAAFVLAFAFVAFMVAAFVIAFAFLTHLGFLRHAFLDACLRCRDSCCLLRLIEVVPALESIDDAFYLSSVFGCHLMALRTVMMVALFFLVLAVAFALCIFLVFLVTLTVAA